MRKTMLGTVLAAGIALAAPSVAGATHTGCEHHHGTGHAHKTVPHRNQGTHQAHQSIPYCSPERRAAARGRRRGTGAAPTSTPASAAAAARRRCCCCHARAPGLCAGRRRADRRAGSSSASDRWASSIAQCERRQAKNHGYNADPAHELPGGRARWFDHRRADALVVTQPSVSAALAALNREPGWNSRERAGRAPQRGG